MKRSKKDVTIKPRTREKRKNNDVPIQGLEEASRRATVNVEENKINDDTVGSSVSLKVGTDVLKVNKALLIANTDYFRGLFNHRELYQQNSDEVDLTIDVDSIADLKLVIIFIESGKVNISASNLRALVTLSSFFGIPNLAQDCSDFMTRTVNLKNIYRYYMYASLYSLQKCEYFVKNVLEARFHDVLIYEEITASIPANELLFILHEGILQHCSKESISDFLLNWIEKKSELNDTDLSVGIKVIEYFNKLEIFRNPPFEGRFSRNVIRMEAILSQKSNIIESSQKFSHLLVDFQQKLPSRTNLRNSSVRSSRGSRQKKKEESTDENMDKTSDAKANNLTKKRLQVKLEMHVPEMVYYIGKQLGKKEVQEKVSGKVEAIFTLSKREYSEINFDEEHLKYLSIEDQLVGDRNDEFDDEDHLFDLCVYDSVSRTWYHVATFDGETYLQQINDGYLRNVDAVHCSLYYFAGEFLFSDKRECYKLVKYNSNQEDWRRIDLLDKVLDYKKPWEMFGDFSMVTMKNGALLMVVEFVECPNGWPFKDGKKDRTGVNFCGFLVNPRYLSIKFIFQTDTIPSAGCDPDNIITYWTSLKIQYSDKSNEMIFLYCNGVGLHAAYVVDLKPWENRDQSGFCEDHDQSSLVQPHLLFHKVVDIESMLDECWFPEAEILELEDRFIVLIVPCRYRAFELTVKYEYLYNSKTLKSVENGAHYEPDHRWGRFYGEPLRSSQDNAYWMFENKYDFSHFKKVTFGSSSEDPATEVHTPPPFCNAVAMYATKVNRTFFSKLKPVKRFLRKSQDTCYEMILKQISRYLVKTAKQQPE